MCMCVSVLHDDGLHENGFEINLQLFSRLVLHKSYQNDVFGDVLAHDFHLYVKDWNKDHLGSSTVIISYIIIYCQHIRSCLLVFD